MLSTRKRKSLKHGIGNGEYNVHSISMFAEVRPRNRDRISSYMRERYRTSQSISKTPPRTSGATRNADHASLQYALIDLRVALREFSSVVGTCPKSYTGDIYHRWWNTQSSKTTILDAAVLHLDGLLSTVSSSHSAILQIAGVGDQLAEADSAGSRIREVVRLLEDILCAALVGRGVADNMYRRKAFVFQSP